MGLSVCLFAVASFVLASFTIIALFSAGGIMSNLSEALVERAMAIAMPSGLHMPAVVEQECAVDCRLSAEKQRTLLRRCKR